MQHFVNELFLVLLCLTYLVFSNAYELPHSTVDGSDKFIIGIIVLFIVFNIVVIIYDVCKFLRLHLKRMRAIVEHRRTRYTIQQVNRVTEKA